NRVPVLLLPADTHASRRPHPVLQQLESPTAGDVSVNDAFRPLSRFFDRIHRPEQLLSALPDAMQVLTDPAATGAVTLALPQDVQTEALEYPDACSAPRTWRSGRPLPDPMQLQTCVQMLMDAERPLIIAGGGVWYSDATAELEALSASLGVPVAETFSGKGALQ